MTILKMTDLDLQGKRVLIREDLNVPLDDGRITSDTRLRAALEGIRLARDAGAAVIVMSHLGRPTEGAVQPQFSLAPVARRLGELLGGEVKLVSDWLNGVDVAPGEVVLAENVRFEQGEKACEESLSRRMAALCDVFVMDAFGTAHRAQASTHGAGKFAPVACAGPLLANELDALGKALKAPEKPLVAIVAGSKVSTKLEVLDALAEKVDQLVVGGGIANTFLAAAGHPVGKSLCEHDLLDAAKALTECTYVPLPVDVVTATAFDESAEARHKDVDEVTEEDMILDIGPQSADAIARLVAEAGTILWNGPVGVFEFEAFSGGTE